MQHVPILMLYKDLVLFSSDDSVIFTDELCSAPQGVVATPGSVEELVGQVKLVLSETLVHQVGSCFQFNISSEDGQHHSYYVDLSQGDGYCKCTLMISFVIEINPAA